MRIETLLEAVIKNQEHTDAKVEAIRAELAADKAELAALKNKGAGILVGVGLAAGGVGAVLTKAVQAWLT